VALYAIRGGYSLTKKGKDLKGPTNNRKKQQKGGSLK
jgi:hypothetical protein